MAGIDNFQQSRENISEQSRQKRVNHDNRSGGIPIMDLLGDGLWGGSEGVRISAITNEIVPLSSSFSRTAVAGEYASFVDVDILE